MLRKISFSVALLASATSVFAATNRPSGYTTICYSGETCSVLRTTNVAFGAAGTFAYKTLSGTFKCSVATFGYDPNPQKEVKECSIPSGADGGGDPSGGATAGVSLNAAGGKGLVDLAWTVKGNITNVQVMRDTDSNPVGRSRIATLGTTTQRYSDTGVKNGTTYWYWIKFGKADGSSDSSNAASATPIAPGIPGNSNECVAGATIKNKTVDCGGKTIGLSCNADSESQPPVLTLINATVKNLRIAKNGGSDGIHCTAGNCTLENVVWEDICEDAASHKSDGGTLTVIGGSAYNDTTGPGGKPDKVFQHNSKNSTTLLTGGFTLLGQHGKLWRSCGDCSNNGGPRNLIIDNVKVNATVGSIAGVNRNHGDKATIRNLQIKNYKMGSPKICEEWKGISKGEGSTQKYGEFWNTPNCNVSPSNVTAF